MGKRQKEGCELWSDFEFGLVALCGQSSVSFDALNEDLFEMQKYFATYLNEIITAETLSEIGELASDEKLAVNTMGKFIADLDEEDFSNIKFRHKLDHFHLYN